ncbi:MAG TPA: hypothetical protein PKM23_14240, partial [bacterium]|nr:hypothetical protein [bacterium]
MMKTTAAKIIFALLFCAGAAALFRPAGGDMARRRVVKYWFVAGVKDNIPLCVQLFNAAQE